MHALQIQNIKRNVVKKANIDELNQEINSQEKNEEIVENVENVENVEIVENVENIVVNNL
jgi:hypothetical protein